MLRIFKLHIFIPLLLAALAAGFEPAWAKVVQKDNDVVAVKSQLPVYVWHDTRVKPKAVVLAIHGLTMHGKVFDVTARHLAAEKFLVAAPDLRGYGSWVKKDARCTTEYGAAEKDLVEVAKALREAYPGIPLFVAGESLGGTAALRLAAHHAELVDGMILSAPALRYRSHFGLRGVLQVAMLATNPRRRIDTSKYVRYFSNDQVIREEELADPLRKNRMGLGELISSCVYMSNSARCVDEVPDDMPVLIMQGERDEMVKRQAVELLEKKLRTSKRSVCWLEGKGHILLETAHVDKKTLSTVTSWLRANCKMRTEASVVAKL